MLQKVEIRCHKKIKSMKKIFFAPFVQLERPEEISTFSRWKTKLQFCSFCFQRSIDVFSVHVLQSVFPSERKSRKSSSTFSFHREKKNSFLLGEFSLSIRRSMFDHRKNASPLYGVSNRKVFQGRNEERSNSNWTRKSTTSSFDRRKPSWTFEKITNSTKRKTRKIFFQNLFSTRELSSH